MSIDQDTEEQKAQKKKQMLETLASWKPSIAEQELFNDDKYWEQSAQEALDKQDKRSGWNIDNGNGHGGNGNGGGNGQPKHDSDNDGNEEKEQENKITEFLDIINERIRELFVDKHDTAFAAVQIREHIETLPIKSSRFNRWICKLFYEELHKTIRAEQLKQITDLLESKALFDGGVIDLQLRVSKSDNSTYYYDLTNKPWQVIKVTANNWNVIESVDAPIMFVRHKSQIAQVLPSGEYPNDIFDKFMNLVNVKTEDSKILLKCYIIALFIPDIAKPILMLHGEQGAAKTMLEELIKSIVDPSSTPTLTFPRTIEELIQQLSHNYLPFYDNLSIIKDWTSDQLCRAVTGSGFSKRKLYSDDEDIIYNFRRGIAFSGVSLAASKADLLDRGIIVELERIPEHKRLKEEDVKAELEAIKPELLGFIFDIIAKVIQVQNNGGIKLDSRSRMADFEEYAEIISRILGHEPNEFIEAYRRNRDLQTDVVIEGNPIAAAVIKLLEEPEYKDCWIGTSTDLLKCLELYAERFKIDTKSKAYPKSASSISYRLNQVKTNLRELGIDVSYTKDTKTRVRVWKIIKSAYDRSERSAVRDSENRAQNGSESANGVANDHSETSKRPFAENGQNRAQNQESERPNDVNGVIRTLDPLYDKPIMKLYGDSWGCNDCDQKGDFWFMEEHTCNGRSKK